MKRFLRLAYVLQDVKYGCKYMIFREQNLYVMIRSDHQSQPWIVGIKPTVVTLKPNDARGGVHHGDLNQTTGISQTTLLCVVFEARRHMLVTMHLTRTHGVVYMKIFDVIERQTVGRRIWLKYLKSSLSMSLIHHHPGHLLTNKIDDPVEQPDAEIGIIHSFPSYVLRRSSAWDPKLSRRSV